MVLRTAPRAATCALALVSLLQGCYEGEWRTGVEVPVGTTSRLLPTRDLERWELTPTVTPYVVRLTADITPRCKKGRFGTTRRIDTGTFHRTGGGYWKAAALTGLTLGGIAAAGGGAGWIARDGGSYAQPAMYAVGGLITAGGAINCILALQQGTPTRKALCGVLSGLGLSLVGGTLLEQYGGLPNPPQPGQTDVFKTLTFAGAGVLGGAAVTGIVAASWRGESERQRVIERQDDSMWDTQESEVACGPPRPLIGRTATLEVFAERVPEGTGSEAQPLKLKVAVTEDGNVPVDLRPLRLALPSCGVLRVQVDPDTIYEQFVEDYTPGSKPQGTSPLGRVIQGRIVPAAGITLSGLEGKARRGGERINVPGFDEEVIGGVERRCKAEIARNRGIEAAPISSSGSREPEMARVAATSRAPGDRPRLDLANHEADRVIAAGSSPASTSAGSPAVSPGARSSAAPGPEPPVEEFQAQKGGSGGPDRPADSGPKGCSAEVRQTVEHECELECGKAQGVGSCVFERRKCQIEARYSQQKQRELELCDLAWEQCIFKAGGGPAKWGQCVESCKRSNEPPACRAQ